MSILSDSEIAALKVERIAYHQVGASGGVLHFNEPTATDLANGFFEGRVRSVCDGSVYRFEPNSAVRNYCTLLLQQEDRFLRNSRDLATMFHDKHRAQMRVGNFMVFLLRTGETRFVALMKYDNQEVVRSLLDANQQLTFDGFKDAFVKDRDSIQKSAIIRFGNHGGPELIVTDRSQRSGLVTTYFKDFLEAVPMRDDRECSTLVFEEARKVLRGIAAEMKLPPDRQRALNAQMRNGLQHGMSVDTSDLPVLVARMTIPEISVDDVVPELQTALKRKQILGETFTLDTTDIRSVRPRQIVTSEGVKIYAPPTAVSRVQISPDNRTITISTAGVLTDDGTSDPPP